MALTEGLISAPLYNDPYVTLTPDAVSIKWFWFPFGLTKVIQLQDIKEVKLLELPCFLRRKHWGQGLSKWWWPLDMRRDWRTHFVEIDVGGRGPVPAVTCDNPHDFHTKLTQALAAKRAQQAPLPSEPQVHVHGAAAPVAVV